MEFAPFYGISNTELISNEPDTASDVDYEWMCGEGPCQDMFDQWSQAERKTIVQLVQCNRFKKSGLPNKDIKRQRRPNKYAEMEFWKRAKNVQLQRQSRSKNTFDASVTILQLKEEWPYDGMSIFLDGLREKTKLGAGW